MKKFILSLMVCFLIFSYLGKVFAEDETIPAPIPRPFLNPAQYTLLEEMLNTHMNYFLSDDAISASGLPLGAYKEDDRARYGYSNPTEWGYALLAWITAVDRDIITNAEAAAKIVNALNTIIALQSDSEQSYHNLFYPYYYVTDPSGNDLASPFHDDNHWIPSIDNGFLYTSLLIVEGWAKINNLTAIETKAHSISSLMNFRIFLRPSGDYIVHSIHADNDELSAEYWNIYADEGGVMAWIAYVSDSITLAEYKILIESMQKPTRTWQDITVDEAAWFNAMFTWGVRSLAGFPVATWETGLQSHYSTNSFANSVEAHLVYGEWLGVYYPAFSDAMTQGYRGRHTPPNIPNEVPTDIPADIVPHALFIPFCIGPDLKTEVLDTLINKIANLKDDLAGYYHNGTDMHKPFGLEVVASSQRNNTSYPGIESRYIFETLGHAYTLLSIQQGLNIHDGNPTFLHYACELPGYFQKVENALLHLLNSGIKRVPEDFSTIQEAIDAAVAGDTILVSAGTYNEHLVLKSDTSLIGTGGSLSTPDNPSDDTTIDGNNADRVIYCSGVTNIIIEGFTIKNGLGTYKGGNIFCSWSPILIRNNLIINGATDLGPGNGGGIYAINSDSIQITGNIIKDNQSWGHGAGIYIEYTDGIISDNIILNNISDRGAGISCFNSSPIIRNNIIDNNYADHQYGGGILCSNSSSPYIINNTFVRNRANGKGGAIYTYGFQSLPVILNNIIAYNSAADSFTGGVYCYNQPYLVDYNNVYNNTGGDYFGCTPGPGSISEDPMFIDFSGRDYHLQTGSLCIDAGSPSPNYNDLNETRNDMGAYGGPYGDLLDYILNMVEMDWHENSLPYSSTGAATCQMILNYIREGAGEPLLTQDEIYEYARDPFPYDGTELNADEVDKVLGHFDPYDYLVSNWADIYDDEIGGNAYQGYSYIIDTYDPALDPDALNNYMRDICHWMAYTVTREDWWRDGELVARPNTPAAVPIYGTYDNWVAVKGCITDINPTPEPHTNPHYSPDFTVYGFWFKDPQVTGIGQDTYKTATECAATYFLPLSTDDSYNGLFLQVAEPPAFPSNASVAIIRPGKDLANLDFVGIKTENSIKSRRRKQPHRKKKSWRDLVDPNLLLDPEAVAAFEGTRMGKPILVNRVDGKNLDYYLVPFGKNKINRQIQASGVIILDAKNGYFKEASWTKKSEPLLCVSKKKALKLIRDSMIKVWIDRINNLPNKKNYRKYIRRIRRYLNRKLIKAFKRAKVELCWEPGSKYSFSPYKPYWKVSLYGCTWHVTQKGEVRK